MNQEGKIYTKTGDAGMTSLIGGSRVPKYHPRIEAYGTIDELNAYIGLIHDYLTDEKTRSILLHIEELLFAAEAMLADENNSMTKPFSRITEKDILLLEQEIDEMNNNLPELHSFILPGGHVIVSFCHIARCVCRRAERITLKLSTDFEIDKNIIKFLNRLSDYLFVLSRKISQDLKAPEIYWKSTAYL